MSAAVVAVVAAALPAVSTARLLRAASAPVQPSSHRIRPDAWVAAMDRAGRYVPGATCLAKSVALAWLLRRRGVDVVVRIGARMDPGLSAHAWVELDGIALSDPQEVTERYVAITSRPLPPPL